MASLIGANIQWLDLKNNNKKKTTELKFTPLSQLYFAKWCILGWKDLFFIYQQFNVRFVLFFLYQNIPCIF